jgi:hypothetical protein
VPSEVDSDHVGLVLGVHVDKRSGWSSTRGSDGEGVERDTNLHHFCHLIAQSIIHVSNLHERCVNTSTRFIIDIWHCEIVHVPILEWHCWLIDGQFGGRGHGSGCVGRFCRR